jgi:hypothetical protein
MEARAGLLHMDGKSLEQESKCKTKTLSPITIVGYPHS